MSPDAQARDYIVEHIETTCLEMFTHDLPALRYETGPYSCFVYQPHGVLFRRLSSIVKPENIKMYIDRTNYQTADNYTVLRNMSNNKSVGSTEFYVFDGKENFANTTLEQRSPMPVFGHIVDMSLDTLIAYDKIQQNGYKSLRTKVKVHPRHNPHNTMECYMYLNTMNDVAKYDPHEAKYKFKHNFSFFHVNKQNGGYFG